MKKMLRKTTAREIRGTFGRFFAICAIILLGAGFFSGVRVTTPAMVNTIDTFLKEHNMYDYRLLSTLGWEEEDVETIRSAKDVRYAEGAYCLDVEYSKNSEDTLFVLKTHSISDKINTLEVVNGRLPNAPGECVIDSKMGEVKIGDVLHIESYGDEEEDEDSEDVNSEDKNSEDENSEDADSDDASKDTDGDDDIEVDVDDDTDEKARMTQDSYKVVGVVHSPYYINFERGTSSIGNGSVAGFVYMLPEEFDSDFYTDIFVKMDQDFELYSDDYNDYMDAHDDEMEEIADAAAMNRYDRVYAEADQKISDAEEEFLEKKADGEKELDDAEKELTDAKASLGDAEKELDDAEKELASGERELNSSKSKLDDARNQLTDAKDTLDKTGEQLAAGKKELDANGKLLSDTKGQLDAAKLTLDANKKKLDDLGAYIQAIEAGIIATPTDATDIESLKAQYSQGMQMYEAGYKEYSDGLAKYEEGYKAYSEAVKKYEDGYSQYQKGLEDYNTGWAEYNDGLSQYYDGKKKLSNGRREYEDGRSEYEDGLKEYEDGLDEYEDGRKEFNDKISEAEDKLADARSKLEDLEKPDTYVLDRESNIGCVCFKSDSEIVAQVARVFPIFFILVAGLVCMTTMSRMVEEQRTQIGVLKALGYSEADIMSKYLMYSGVATVVGCILGYLGGIVLFPTVIWSTYQLMYIHLPIKITFDAKLASLVFIAAILCSVGTTWISARVELLETAANLMRPKAPKAGKRVALEYIPSIWNRLKFLHKVSVRNILRYKGRFFMMIVGVSGCMALVMTGFGINDSIAGFAEEQYGEIQITDADVTLKDLPENGDIPEELLDKINKVSDEYKFMYQGTWDLVYKGGIKSINLVAMDDFDSMDKFMLYNDMNGDRVEYPKQGEAIISNSIMERYGKKVGDTITLRDSDMNELTLKVTGVFENRVYNYIFIGRETLTAQQPELSEINAAYINFKKGKDIYKCQAELSDSKYVANITLLEEFKKRMSDMMSRLKSIVFVVILSAAALAFIVIYNLTNINITERIREIATIKVLGFFRNETSAYVMRENVILTAFGIAVGLLLGVALHRFVMNQIVVDLVSFKVQIKPLTYLYSVLLTFAFNWIVNMFMGIKLERINMAESLKSVD